MFLSFYNNIGAKVLLYDDPKYGPSIELNWTARLRNVKHYHVNYSLKKFSSSS